MRAVVCTEFGPPSALVVREEPTPELRQGQVLISVEAAGVNFVDALFTSGEYQIRPPLPFVPGGEVAGTVTAVGEGVSSILPGQRVLASCGLGGFATEVVTSELSTVAIPDSLHAVRAAAFAQSYCTALFALRDRARLGEGEHLVVLGAGGGVGLAGIDVARVLGASPIAVASTPEKREVALAQGAVAAIDSTSDDLKVRVRELTGGSGADVVLDPVGGELAEPALRALDVFGRYLVVGFASGTIPRLPLNQVLLRNRSVVGVDWGAWGMSHPVENRALLSEALDLVDAGRLHPVVPTSYPFDQVAAALDDLQSRRVTGKVVLIP